ncbi:Uncharacterized protein HZ326_18629 [Fusarium oxysporum f. sp. albedinis]|nr:Uncharacterized protein HZ326_18629 [Fusarium oxysporum f. sp. albedinis]
MVVGIVRCELQVFRDSVETSLYRLSLVVKSLTSPECQSIWIQILSFLAPKGMLKHSRCNFNVTECNLLNIKFPIQHPRSQAATYTEVTVDGVY